MIVQGTNEQWFSTSMGSMGSGSDHQDLEAQHSPLTAAVNPGRARWRWIILLLQAHQNLISRSADPRRSISLVETSSASSYTVLSTSDTDNHEDSEPNVIGRILSPSPQVSFNIPSDADDVPRRSDSELQHANIAKIVKERDLNSLLEFGGVQGIAEALHTDLEKGIRGDEQDLHLRRIAGTNSAKTVLAPTFFQCLLKACNSSIIFLLLFYVVSSICFGIKKEGLGTGWYEGLIILIAVIIIVLCHSMRDFWNEEQHMLSEKHNLSEKMETVVEVSRRGNQRQVSISDLVLGDIVRLRRGYLVPADGLFVRGEALELDDHPESVVDDQNPFMFYGAKVIRGEGTMLVTSVGMNTDWGEMMSKVSQAPNKTPLQAQLDKVNTWTQIFGLLICIFMIIELLLRLKLEKEDDNPGFPELKGKPSTIKGLMDVVKRFVFKPNGKVSLLTTSLTVLLVGITEGYPLAITISLKYWNKKTLSRKAFAQELLACPTMGSLTTICTDKIGGLSLIPAEVEMCRIGDDINGDSVIHSHVLDTLCDGIYTSVLDPKNSSSSEEEAILSWATLQLGMRQDTIKQRCNIEKFYSSEEVSRALVKKSRENETTKCLHWKGPATTILAQCSSYHDSEGRINDMERKKRRDFEEVIKEMQSKDLKTIAFAYKKFCDWSSEENNLTLIGLLGLRDTDRRATRDAVQACRHAGVNIKLVSRDKIQVLEAIGHEYGILNPNSLVIEGEEFRNYSKEEMMDKVDQISIMGNSLPSDKLLLVECLKQKGHIVAVVGARIDETPALKEANVGITMGTCSTELPKATSDIVIVEGNFSFLVTIMRHARGAYENIQKYIQHELTMVISGLLVLSITTGLLGDAPITSIQLSCGSLILGIPGGFALLTEPPPEKLIGNQSVGQGGRLISKSMWRNIIIQSLYQVTILVTTQCKGKSIPGISNKVNKSLVFNSFALCQVFNLFNCRKLEKKNVFKGLCQNHWFSGAVVVSIGLQAAFMEVGHLVGGSLRLNYQQWAISFLIGMASLVIDLAGKSASDFINMVHPQPPASIFQ